MSYDSRKDTLTHIGVVRTYLADVVVALQERMRRHDASKLEEPEKAAFDEFTPRLQEVTYGSPEYQECLNGMAEALTHHYAENDHHPEHFPGGIADMGLVQMIEMLADWKAAGERHDPPNPIVSSIKKNRERFGYGEEIERLLINTAKGMGWV